MTAFIRQLLGALLLVSCCVPARAAEIWFYDLRDPPNVNTTSVRSADKHWVLTQFDDDPYPGQLALLGQASGFQKISLLFARSPSPALGDEYAEAATSLLARGVQTQLKFMGTLPTADEARILRRACDAGAKVVYISSSIPTSYEAANLQSLRDCVEVDLALGHYPKYDEINDLKLLTGVPLVLVNDYFPQYPHMDALNILGLPVGVHVSDGVPETGDMAFVNAIKPLTAFSWEMKVVPDAGVYATLAKFDRKGGTRRFSLRWAIGQPGDADVAAWLTLAPDRLQVSAETFSKYESQLRALKGEVLVETFLIDGVTGIESTPLH